MPRLHPHPIASPDYPPFLLVHGDADTVVPSSQSELFHEELTKTGVTVELIRVRGESHGTLAVPNAPDDIDAMVAWFNRHLRIQPWGLPR